MAQLQILCSVTMGKQVCSTLKAKLQEMKGVRGVKIQDFECVWDRMINI